MHQHMRGSPTIWHTDQELFDAVALERRLSDLEHSDREIKRDLRQTKAQHGRRITALEGKPSWTPRDYALTAIGAGILLAAVLEKIGWGPAIAALIKLYGIK